MHRVLTVLSHYLRIGFASEMQYRVNFFIQLLQALVALAVGLIGQSLVFSHTTDLRGWNRSELLVVLGVYMLMGGLIQAFVQPNMNRLLDEIHEGTLDYALVKPVDSQVLVSMREFRAWQLVDVLVGAVVMGWGIQETGQTVGLGQSLAFALALVMGAVMLYCFWLILTTTAFWFIRIWEMVNLFQGLYAAGRWPVGIYPNWLRLGLTFIVPVAFAVTVPAEALVGRLTAGTLLGALGLTVLLVVTARLFWRLGVRSYSGASA
jgi:ABC-2 type transport system permease protein